MQPGVMTVLFDGSCRFCTRSARLVQQRLGPSRVTLQDFQAPGALDPYPAVTPEAAMKKMHLVLPDGRMVAGAEAVAHLVQSLRFVGWLGYVYYVPGVRQLAELGYAFVARRRYALLGRDGTCDETGGGTCHLHGR